MLWFKSSQYFQQGYPGQFEKARSTRFTFILSDNNHKLLVTIIYYYDLVWLNILWSWEYMAPKRSSMTHTVWLKLYVSYPDVVLSINNIWNSVFFEWDIETSWSLLKMVLSLFSLFFRGHQDILIIIINKKRIQVTTLAS